MAAADQLEADGVSAEVIDVATLKPLDSDGAARLGRQDRPLRHRARGAADRRRRGRDRRPHRRARSRLAARPDRARRRLGHGDAVAAASNSNTCRAKPASSPPPGGYWRTNEHPDARASFGRSLRGLFRMTVALTQSLPYVSRAGGQRSLEGRYEASGHEHLCAAGSRRRAAGGRARRLACRRGRPCRRRPAARLGRDREGGCRGALAAGREDRSALRPAGREGQGRRPASRVRGGSREPTPARSSASSPPPAVRSAATAAASAGGQGGAGSSGSGAAARGRSGAG